MIGQLYIITPQRKNRCNILVTTLVNLCCSSSIRSFAAKPCRNQLKEMTDGSTIHSHVEWISEKFLGAGFPGFVSHMCILKLRVLGPDAKIFFFKKRPWRFPVFSP